MWDKPKLKMLHIIACCIVLYVARGRSFSNTTECFSLWFELEKMLLLLLAAAVAAAANESEFINDKVACTALCA